MANEEHSPRGHVNSRGVTVGLSGGERGALVQHQRRGKPPGSPGTTAELAAPPAVEPVIVELRLSDRSRPRLAVIADLAQGAR
jgi:hypothetical protein